MKEKIVESLKEKYQKLTLVQLKRERMMLAKKFMISPTAINSFMLNAVERMVREKEKNKNEN
jgi:hypothetical protein